MWRVLFCNNRQQNKPKNIVPKKPFRTHLWRVVMSLLMNLIASKTPQLTCVCISIQIIIEVRIHFSNMISRHFDKPRHSFCPWQYESIEAVRNGFLSYYQDISSFYQNIRINYHFVTKKTILTCLMYGQFAYSTRYHLLFCKIKWLSTFEYRLLRNMV